MLELALPDQEPRRVGALLVDVKTEQLYCKINAVRTDDEDVSEVLAYLADDLTAQALERGGKALLRYLQDTLSNVFRITDSKRIYVENPTDAVNRLADGLAEVEEGSREHAKTISTSSSSDSRKMVLIVEDNPADVVLIQEGFRQCSIDTDFTIVTDGEQAIRLIDSIGRDGPKPDLILLDINLPKCDGFEVLESLRSRAQLKATPVAMLTTSFRGVDFERACISGANCYAIKGCDLDGLANTIRALSTFCWQSGSHSVLGFMNSVA